MTNTNLKIQKTFEKATEVETVSKPTSARRRFLFQGILILLIIAFAALTIIVKVIPFTVFDLPITKFIQYFNPFWFDFWMRFISGVGNAEYGSLILVLVSLGLYFKRRKAESLTLIISGFGAEVLSLVLKALVRRPRPDPDLITQLEHFTRNDSFPSGHVLFAMGVYGLLLFLVFTKFQKGILRSILMGFFLFLIISMGLSRIYKGAHWFSDTLGSYLIGTVWLFLMVSLYKRLKI